MQFSLKAAVSKYIKIMTWGATQSKLVLSFCGTKVARQPVLQISNAIFLCLSLMHDWGMACSSLTLAPACYRQEAFLIYYTAVRGIKWGHDISSAKSTTFLDRFCNKPGGRESHLSAIVSFPGSQTCLFHSWLCHQHCLTLLQHGLVLLLTIKHTP